MILLWVLFGIMEDGFGFKLVIYSVLGLGKYAIRQLKIVKCFCFVCLSEKIRGWILMFLAFSPLLNSLNQVN